MKIGIVTTWFERGAAYVSKQYEQLLQDEHEVFIYARGGEEYAIGDPEWDKENVWWGKRYALPITATYVDENDFINWIHIHNIEVILFNEQRWWQPLKICKEMGIKTGAYIDYYTKDTIPLYSAYDFLICNTERHYSVFSDHPQCYYVPWGTDVELFSMENDKLVEDNTLTFFHSSGMNPFRKGTDQVIKAFNILQEKHDNIKLIIHTQVNLEKFFPKLKSTINNLLDKEKIKIIEKTVRAPGLYHLGDIYVYPSRLEGIGLTLAEAISCGLPIITSDNSPMNEFVDNSFSKVVKIEKYYKREDDYYWSMCEVDLIDLAEKMEFYVKNVDKMQIYKQQARTYALKSLNWKKNQRSLSSIFLASKILPIDDEVFKLIDKEDNSKFPFISKVPMLYKHLFFIYRTIKHMVKGKK